MADAARLGAFVHSDTRAQRPLQCHSTVTLTLYRKSEGWERFEPALEKTVEAAYLAGHPHTQAAEFSPHEQKQVIFQYDLKGMKKVSLACVMHACVHKCMRLCAPGELPRRLSSVRCAGGQKGGFPGNSAQRSSWRCRSPAGCILCRCAPHGRCHFIHTNINILYTHTNINTHTHTTHTHTTAMQHATASPAGAHRLQKEMSAPAILIHGERAARNVGKPYQPGHNPDTGERTWDRPEKQEEGEEKDRRADVQVCMQVCMCALLVCVLEVIHKQRDDENMNSSTCSFYLLEKVVVRMRIRFRS